MLEFEAPINMNGKAITNLKDPVNDQDAVTKKYMETHVSNSHVTSSNRSNAFQYVMNNPSHLIEEDDIEFGGLVTFQSSPHSINKKAIDTKLLFDAGHGYYSSRLSINLFVLPNGSYTMAFELIWSSVDDDKDSVSLNGLAVHETIHDLSNKTFDNYSRSIMQFTKSTDSSPNHLYIDIVIKIKTGKLYPPKLQTYMVCYGIKGLQLDVPSNIYDALWGVDNGVVTFNETINMGNNVILGIKTGNHPTGAVNFLQLMTQLQDAETQMRTWTNQLINKKINENKNRYELLFDYWFDCLDPNMFNYHTGSLDGLVAKINDKLVMNTFRSFSDFNKKDGFQIHGSHIALHENYNQNSNFTMFVAFKHDKNISQTDQYLGFGDGSSFFPPFIKITADDLYLYKTANTYTRKTMYSAQKDKYLMIWFTKNGNTYRLDLCDDAISITETISPVQAFLANKIYINFRYFIQRIGVSKTFYSVDDIEFHKIIFLEKSKGTHFA